ncbi:MAG: hypothetical protein NUV97_00835 [archaeon]|nr:hypothetical protein [archaeon]MCR4323493.1 hypothetical protein [Nanoarchaeota archaeon]
MNNKFLFLATIFTLLSFSLVSADLTCGVQHYNMYNDVYKPTVLMGTPMGTYHTVIKEQAPQPPINQYNQPTPHPTITVYMMEQQQITLDSCSNNGWVYNNYQQKTATGNQVIFYGESLHLNSCGNQ